MSTSFCPRHFHLGHFCLDHFSLDQCCWLSQFVLAIFVSVIRTVGDMDAGLYDTLKRNGVTEPTLSILMEEAIATTTFTIHQKEHWDKLLTKLPVGQHAVILDIWEKQHGNF